MCFKNNFHQTHFFNIPTNLVYKKLNISCTIFLTFLSATWTNKSSFKLVTQHEDKKHSTNNINKVSKNTEKVHVHKKSFICGFYFTTKF